MIKFTDVKFDGELTIAPPPTEEETKAYLLTLIEGYPPAQQYMMAKAIHEGCYHLRAGYLIFGGW